MATEMPVLTNDTVTLAMSGDEVPMTLYARGTQHFSGLVEQLTRELAGKARLDWRLDSLTSVEAAAMTFRAVPGSTDAPDRIGQVARGFLAVGRALRGNEQPLFSPGVQREAAALRGLLNGKIQAIRFETAEDDATVLSDSARPTITPTLWRSYGALRGRVQTLTSRRGYRFTLFDSLDDRAVACYLDGGQEDIMRGVWGRRAIVEGLISRDPISGRPVALRHITSIIPLEDEPRDSYKEARGVFPADPEESPEDLIRRLRDAV